MIVTLGFSWQVGLLGGGFGVVCLFLILVILIQKPKGGGLSGAFGGAGGGSAHAAFGAKTGDVLTGFTVLLFILFLGIAIGMTRLMHPAGTQPQQPQNSPAKQAVHRASSVLPAGQAKKKSSNVAADAQNLNNPEKRSTPTHPNPAPAGGKPSPANP